MNEQREPRRTIVLGLDGSKGAQAALLWCCDAAPRLEADVVAVYTFYSTVADIPSTMALPPVSTADPQFRHALADALEEWCAPLRDAGVQYRTVVFDGSPAEVLIRVAEDLDASLVVVGRRGSGGFVEMLLGSVPHTLSHRARTPLVIVPVPSEP